MKRFARTLCLALTVVLMLSSALPVRAASVNAEYCYTITGLRSKYAAQKTVIYGNYMYVVQHANVKGGVPAADGTTPADSYLTRCRIVGNTAVAEGEPMILKNFGHAQSLEVFDHNGKTYIFINCKNNETANKPWGIQVARIEYQPGATIKYTSVPRISFGSVKRVEFAVSTNNQQMLFWVHDGSKGTFSIYNTADINKKLNAKAKESQKWINISKFSGSLVNSTTSCAAPSGFPNTSNQGLELTNARSIYICGGATGDTPKITKLLKNGNGYKKGKTATLQYFGEDAEIEGLQIKGDYIYFGITYHKLANDSGRFQIYRIPKSYFD